MRKALGVGVVAAAPVAYYKTRGTPAPERHVPVRTVLPRAPEKLKLYQYESCPFCRKVRAVLDYSGLPYEIHEVHPLSKRETKPFAPDYSKVPILTAQIGEDECQLRNSSDIVNAVLECQGLARPVAVAGPRRTPGTAVFWDKADIEAEEDVEKRWVRWADQVLVQLAVLNIYRTLDESQETFRYLLTHPQFTAFEKFTTYWSGVLVMRMVCEMRNRKYKLEDARGTFLESVDMVADAVGTGFIGGDRPSAADFNVFGVLRSLESFTTEKIMFERTKIGPYYERMAAFGAGPAGAGAALRSGKATVEREYPYFELHLLGKPFSTPARAEAVPTERKVKPVVF
jgi:microsomal prostaglandin-E synthase 2